MKQRVGQYLMDAIYQAGADRVFVFQVTLIWHFR